MAAETSRLLYPGLWDTYRHELFKGRKQRFCQAVVFMPAILTLAFILFLMVVSAFSPAVRELPQANQSRGSYDMGEGVFPFTAGIILQGFGTPYILVLVLACALMVANEYRWNTIKMLATRQASRVRLAAAKCLFGMTLIALTSVVFILSWLVLTLCVQALSNSPVGIVGESDAEAIGKVLHYYGLTTLQTAIFALLAIALTFRVKSIVGGLIAYLVYNTVDTQASHIGAGLSHVPVEVLAQAGWARPGLEALRAIHPFLLTSNVDYLAMRAGADEVSAFITPAGAWLALAAYAVFFTALTLWIFARRDITD
jgi:ABC-type transport system involved in multi-copper enzyme maturation permease subunit